MSECGARWWWWWYGRAGSSQPGSRGFCVGTSAGRRRGCTSARPRWVRRRHAHTWRLCVARVLAQLRDVGIELPVAWRPLRPCTHTVSHSASLVLLLLLWRLTESARRRVARGDTLAAEREVKASQATLRVAEQRFETAGGHLHREVSDWHTLTLSLSLSLSLSLARSLALSLPLPLPLPLPLSLLEAADFRLQLGAVR
eukprot:COSAG01_NODE_4824_length_4713_cov_47.864759_4_plen_199_part_00